MAVPSLKLDLAPPSNLWRLNHGPLGLAALACGCLLLAGSVGLTWRAYAQAAAAGKRTVLLTTEASRSSDQQRQVLAELRGIDVAKELPRWRLAEKIFTERSLPWSRLTAELERSLVEDVRLKSIQRTRSNDLRVQLKIKGEARTREAEARFVESLQRNEFFEAVLLEREAERQGGGVDFEYTLAAQPIPPAFVPLPKQPKYGPVKAPGAPAKPAAAATRLPAPVRLPAARPAATPAPVQVQIPGRPRPANDSSPAANPAPPGFPVLPGAHVVRPFPPHNLPGNGRPVPPEGPQP
jgi:Tfp pilus assembly protein PilN